MTVLYRHKEHQDNTVEKPFGTFHLTRIIQNLFHGELIMYICSTALKNTFSGKCTNRTMSTFCAKTTYILLCVICFYNLIITSILFNFSLLSCLEQLSLVFAIWFAKFILCDLLFAFCFVLFASRNWFCEICFMQFALNSVALLMLHLSRRLPRVSKMADGVWMGSTGCPEKNAPQFLPNFSGYKHAGKNFSVR